MMPAFAVQFELIAWSYMYLLLAFFTMSPLFAVLFLKRVELFLSRASFEPSLSLLELSYGTNSDQPIYWLASSTSMFTIFLFAEFYNECMRPAGLVCRIGDVRII